MLTRRSIRPISSSTTSVVLHSPSKRPRLLRRPIRWAAFTLALLVGVWAGGGRSAEAACEPVSPAVMPSPVSVLFPSEMIVVIWRVDPACGVVETGLLMGRDPGALRPVGQPIYGYRDRYEQSVPVQESGLHVLAAYIRDEAGQVVQSPPVPVMVVVPPPPFPDDDTHGSHGPLSSYTGTDADFLKPAGEPHFASVRSATTTYQGTWNFPDYPQIGVVAGRRVSSTHPDEVLAQQASPITGYGESFAVPRAQVQAAVDRLDESFRGFRYPRPGLYSVTCAVEVLQPGPDPDPRCGYDTYYYFGTYWYGLPVAYAENASTYYARTSRSSARSTLTYFIPAPPSGKWVASARFLAYVSGYGEMSAVRLSGKPPARIDPNPSCAQPGRYCYMWVTWDFTEEARALAARGGGELVLTLDPIPPKVEPWPYGHLGQQSTAEWGFRVNVNYPWRHSASLSDGLVLTFEDHCPQELKVSVMPSAIRPDLPSVPENLAAIPRKAVVEAIVKRCQAVGSEAPVPEEVIVTFAVFAPKGGSQDDGGHEHDSAGRETGTLRDSQGTMVNSCMVREFNEHGIGTCQVIYHAGPIAGTEFIGAVASGYQEVGVPVIVGVPESFNLPTDESRYVAVGNRGSHAGTNDPCRPIRPASLHSANHFGQPKLIGAIRDVAAKMLKETGIKLRVNDMSLPWGGLFDVKNNWSPPHKSHRVGIDVDIGFSGVRDGMCAPYEPDRLQEALLGVLGGSVVEEGDHFHLRVR